MNGQLAGFGHEQITFDADEVTMIEQIEKLPTIDFAAIRVIAYAGDILTTHVNLQTRSAVGEMHERGFAHHARRRGDAAGDAHVNFIQFVIGRFERVDGRFLSCYNLRLETFELFDYGSNCVFAGCVRGDIAALELVRIDVAHQLAQSFEVFVPRPGLVIVGNDILRKLISQRFSPIDKGRIIERVIGERKLTVNSNGPRKCVSPRPPRKPLRPLRLRLPLVATLNLFYRHSRNSEGNQMKLFFVVLSVVIAIMANANAIFSLLKKEYDTPRTRALSATARLKAMPFLIEQGQRNLTKPVKLYAQLAIDSARSIDSLLKDSMMTALAKDLSPQEMNDLVTARDAATNVIHSYADWLEKRAASMPPFAPMGEANYNYLLKHVYLLPLDAKQVEMLGQTELARARAMESMLPNPALADPNPARAKIIPKDQDDFLKAYESREAEMIAFLKENQLVTLPSYLGRFEIRQLPEAFKPTSPGGFMNAPGVYDQDPTGFYFIPTYDPKSENFYIRAAIEDPRPILGHEGIPGHFLQLSIANHLKDEIRRQHSDGIMIEGWALYGEEMLMRTGLYPLNSASQGQILRLARYRSARIGVDVNLHTGRWTFEQAVKYFMEAGGLDREAAEGEAAGAASDPTQKITYMVGKWQIMRLLGLYRDRKGKDFRLGAFHDQLLKNVSLPLSSVEWILLDDPGTLDGVLKPDAAPRANSAR